MRPVKVPVSSANVLVLIQLAPDHYTTHKEQGESSRCSRLEVSFQPCLVAGICTIAVSSRRHSLSNITLYLTTSHRSLSEGSAFWFNDEGEASVGVGAVTNRDGAMLAMPDDITLISNTGVSFANNLAFRCAPPRRRGILFTDLSRRKLRSARLRTTECVRRRLHGGIRYRCRRVHLLPLRHVPRSRLLIRGLRAVKMLVVNNLRHLVFHSTHFAGACPRQGTGLCAIDTVGCPPRTSF